MAVHAYIRVSSEHSKNSGLSPAAQVTALTEYKALNLPDVEWAKTSYGSMNDGFYLDLAVSAWKKEKGLIANRPAGSLMLKSLQPGDHILFYSVCRGFRNVGDFGSFLNMCAKHDWHCHFVKEGLDMSTPSGRMRAHIYAAMAEYYSSILSARVREAFSINKKKLGPKSKPIKKPAFDRIDSKSIPTREVKPKPKVPGKIWLYGRCSGVDQVESMLGILHQESAVRRYGEKLIAENELLTIHDKYMTDLGISAFKNPFSTRPSGKEVFTQAKSGDHIVALRFDRIFRSVKDMNRTIEDLDRRGITLHLVDDGVRTDRQESRIYMNLLVSISQIESEMKSIRQKEIVRKLREKGLPVNKEVPNGHKIVKRNGQKMVVLDFNEMADLYTTLIYTEEMGMSSSQAALRIRVIRAMRENQKPTFKHDLMSHPENIRPYAKRAIEAFAASAPATALAEVKKMAISQSKMQIPGEYIKCWEQWTAKPSKNKRKITLPF